MKTFILLSSFFLFCQTTAAQQFLIRYDLAEEEVRYFKIRKRGDTVSVPVISLVSGQTVSLQLLNASGGYRQRITYISKPEPAESVLIPGIGNAGSGPLSALLPAAENKLLDPGDIFRTTGADRPDNKSADAYRQNRARQLFTAKYNEFSTASRLYAQAALFDQQCHFLWRELARLRYNTGDKGESIRQSATEKTEGLFPGASRDLSLILQVKEEQNTSAIGQQLAGSLQALETVYGSFAELEIFSPAADSLLRLARNRTKYALPNGTGAGILSGDRLREQIASLFSKISQDQYRQLSQLDINRQTVTAAIDFLPAVDSVTSLALEDNRPDSFRRLIPILKKEPVRFRNTFGFSFVSYAENRWHYFVRSDGVIDREEADLFQPVVVSFLHFYAPRDKGFRWGGSFGAGLPVGGDNTKLNILLGLSTFFGKNDPVSLTLGISGTQVKKLSGYKLGDTVNFTELGAGHFASVYRAGYFFSLSFNPASLSSND